MSAAIAEATADQPVARKALAAAAAEPFHAYLFAGPRGSGKGGAARALAAELLADGAPDPADARRRALADPSPHPDLTWLRPPGTQHLVEIVRERVIAQIAYRPFEGERRVFVIEDADAMAEESQNALLKTLEEPPAFAHLILVSAEPEALLETVRSRCRAVRFARLGPDAVEARLEGADSDAERRAAARLSGGDLGMASFLVTEEGRRLRAGVEALARAVRRGELADAPWTELASAADAAGEREAGAVRERAAEEAEESAERSGPGARKRSREAEELAKRASRLARNTTLDTGLGLLGSWMRDLAAVAEGGPELVLNADRAAELAELGEGLDPRRARRAGELVMETRRRLQVNVSEALALEALAYRLEYLLSR
ncbi:MAG: AAA family ATPase [Solirubrobacterales bacterium]